MTCLSIIQVIHDGAEQHGRITWFGLGTLLLELGGSKPLVGAALSWADAVNWYAEEAIRLCPHTPQLHLQLREAAAEETSFPSIVQQLNERGIAGEVAWRFKGSFEARIHPPHTVQRLKLGRSWGEVDGWLGAQAAQ